MDDGATATCNKQCKCKYLLPLTKKSFSYLVYVHFYSYQNNECFQGITFIIETENNSLTALL